MDAPRTFEVQIEGLTALLMHQDNVEWADEMKAWGADPKNKKTKVAGDDRTPAHRWLGTLWTGGGNVAVPGQALTSMISKAGASVAVPGAKGGKTFKAQAAAAIRLAGGGAFVPLMVRGKALSAGFIEDLKDEDDFSKHQKMASKLGFHLDVRPVVVNQKRHIRVRPRFDQWTITPLIDVFDKQITSEVLSDLYSVAGEYVGLGDWRPGSPKKPGPFGMFRATVRAAKKA